MEIHKPDFRPDDLPLDNSGRAKMSINILWVCIGIIIVQLFLFFVENQQIRSLQAGEDVSDGSLRLVEILLAVSFILLALAYITSGILFLNWFRRAYANIERVSKPMPDHEENMAVWGFFIPFINLYRPYNIMEEIWKKTQVLISYAREDYEVDFDVMPIRIWWSILWVAGVAARLADSFYERAEELSEILMANQFLIFSGFIDIASAWFALDLIRKVSNFEDILYEEMQELEPRENLVN